jgi:hypothetical protein
VYNDMAKTQSVSDLHTELSKDIKSAPTPLNRTSLSRALIVTIYPASYHPSDRLVFFGVKVIPDSGFAFSGLTATSTSWGSQMIDTLDVSSSTQFQPELDVTMAGYVQGTVKGPLSSNHSTDVKSTDLEPFLLPTANIVDKQLHITAVGARGISLYGTTVAKLKLAPEPDNTDAIVQAFVVTDMKLMDPKGAPLDPSNASMHIALVTTLKSDAIGATTCFRYVLRHVTNGQDTYREDDDLVTFISPKTLAQHVTLTDASETRFTIWRIFDGKDRPVAATTDMGTYQLGFLSLEDVLRFQMWISASKAKSVDVIGSTSIGTWPSDETAGPLLPLPTGPGHRLFPLSYTPKAKVVSAPPQSDLDHRCADADSR